MVERSGWFLGVTDGIDQASSEKLTLPTPSPRPDVGPPVASARDDPQCTLGNGVGVCFVHVQICFPKRSTDFTGGLFDNFLVNLRRFIGGLYGCQRESEIKAKKGRGRGGCWPGGGWHILNHTLLNEHFFWLVILKDINSHTW